MSDNEPRSKSSMQVDEEIQKDIAENRPIRPHLIAPTIVSGNQHFETWVDNAFREAQEDKERFLGRRPPKPQPQPSVAISNFQHRWLTASMNNKRELGPGDVKK